MRCPTTNSTASRLLGSIRYGCWASGAPAILRTLDRDDPAALASYRRILPDFQDADLVGSMFAITDYMVSDGLGGDAALAVLRERLHARGASDARFRPEPHRARSSLGVEPSGVLYRRHRRRPRARTEEFRSRAADGRVFAFGRDPYFPGWSDTFQLNYRDPRLRTAMAGGWPAWRGFATACAVIWRCFVFPTSSSQRGATARGRSMAPCPSIRRSGRTRSRRRRAVTPELFLLAEVYWGLEDSLLGEGFDCVYDKSLYDHLRARRLGGTRPSECSRRFSRPTRAVPRKSRRGTPRRPPSRTTSTAPRRS